MMKRPAATTLCIVLASLPLAVACQSGPPKGTTTTAQINLLRPLMTEAQVVSIVGPCAFGLLIFNPPGPKGYSFKFCDYVTEADSWHLRITADDKLESVCSSKTSACLVDTRPPLTIP